MLSENAIVLDYQAGIATVKCQAQSACGSCSAKQGCGSSALSELTGARGEHIFKVSSLMPLRAGQLVEIGLQERSLMQSVLLIYCLPLLSLLLSTLLGAQFFQQELANALFIFICTALSFLFVRIYAKRLNKKSAYQPILLRVLS